MRAHGRSSLSARVFELALKSERELALSRDFYLTSLRDQGAWPVVQFGKRQLPRVAYLNETHFALLGNPEMAPIDPVGHFG